MTALSDGVVVLRALVPADEDALYAACQDRELLDFTDRVPDPYTREDAAAFVAAQAGAEEPARAIAWAAAPDALIGVIGLDRIDHVQGTASVGYWIAREHRGRGAATRALELLIAHAEDALGLLHLRLWADIRNVASHRVAEKAGFVVASHEPRMVRGALRDTVRYALPPRRLRRARERGASG